MKTALLLSGQFREALLCFPSIKEKILDRFNPDVFISCWNPDGEFSWTTSRSTENLVDSLSINEIIQMYKPKSIKSEDFNSPIIEKVIEKAWNLDVYGPMTGETNPVSIFCMWYKIRSAFDLMEQYELSVGEDYDLVIKGRFDINLHDDLVIPENLENISIPPGFDWRGGINDILAYGGRKSMGHYCKMYEVIEPYIIYDGIFFHPETLLKHHLVNSEFGFIRPDLRVSLRNSNIWEREVIEENFKKILQIYKT